MVRTGFPYKIYVITSPSEKQYVGITMKDLKIRWRGHITNAYFRKENYTFLGRAIKKYGKDAFIMDCIDTTNTQYKARKLEVYYINELNTLWPNGYNMTPSGGAGVPGFTHSDKVKEFLSKSRKEYYANPINRKDQSDRITKVYNTIEGKETQRKRSLLQNKPKTKAKIKKILKELRSTPEYRKAKSIEQKQVWSNPILKKKHSELTKDQYKNGRVTWNKGKKTGPRSEKTKLKISKTLKEKNGHNNFI